MLHYDPIADDLARVVADVGLMMPTLDVDPGGGEVSEVRQRRSITATWSKFRRNGQRRAQVNPSSSGYAAKCIECLAVLLFRLGLDVVTQRMELVSR